MDLEKELEVCIKLAIEAGKKILEIYKTDFEVEYKDDKSPLTEADKQSNELIVSTLAKKFPRYAILAEESKDNKDRLKNDWCWVIDPLDGTKEFLKRNVYDCADNFEYIEQNGGIAKINELRMKEYMLHKEAENGGL